MSGPLPRLLRIAQPLRGWLALSVLLGAATVGSSVGLMATAAFLIASAALSPPLAVLQVAIVGVRFFGIARGVFRYLERLASHHATFGLLAHLRVWFYQAVEQAAPGALDETRSADLAARAVADIETLQEFFVRALAPPLVALLVSLGSALFVARFSARMGLTLFAFLLLGGTGVPLAAWWLSRGPGVRQVALRAELYPRIVDVVQGLPDLSVYGAATRHRAEIERLGEQTAAAQRRLASVEGTGAALSHAVTVGAMVALLAQGVPLVRAGTLSGVQLTVVALAALASFEAVQPLPDAARHLAGSLEAARRLFDAAGATPRPASAGTAHTPPLRGYALDLREVSFRYAAGALPALDGVSLSLPEGGRVAVVGPSGAGKSTLAALLLRLADYSAGSIRLGGRELANLPAEVVRDTITLVSQHTHLFNETIRTNLRLANPAATPAMIEAAARRAQIHEFIRGLPDGYDTLVGERGAQLSGGERQRLALARALLREAHVLVLDEPTANLDAATARAAMAAILAASAGHSLLLITHRLTGLEAVDQIVVMQGGRTVARGTHAELLREGGWYAQMWALEQDALL